MNNYPDNFNTAAYDAYWGDKTYSTPEPVALKAMIRICAAQLISKLDFKFQRMGADATKPDKEALDMLCEALEENVFSKVLMASDDERESLS